MIGKEIKKASKMLALVGQDDDAVTVCGKSIACSSKGGLGFVLYSQDNTLLEDTALRSTTVEEFIAFSKGVKSLAKPADLSGFAPGAKEFSIATVDRSRKSDAGLLVKFLCDAYEQTSKEDKVIRGSDYVYLCARPGDLCTTLEWYGCYGESLLVSLVASDLKGSYSVSRESLKGFSKMIDTFGANEMKAYFAFKDDVPTIFIDIYLNDSLLGIISVALKKVSDACRTLFPMSIAGNSFELYDEGTGKIGIDFEMYGVKPEKKLLPILEYIDYGDSVEVQSFETFSVFTCRDSEGQSIRYVLSSSKE